MLGRAAGGLSVARISIALRWCSTLGAVSLIVTDVAVFGVALFCFWVHAESVPGVALIESTTVWLLPGVPIVTEFQFWHMPQTQEFIPVVVNVQVGAVAVVELSVAVAAVARLAAVPVYTFRAIIPAF